MKKLQTKPMPPMLISLRIDSKLYGEYMFKSATFDFERAMQLFWSEIFGGISNNRLNDRHQLSSTVMEIDENEKESKDDTMRGAFPDVAL